MPSTTPLSDLPTHAFSCAADFEDFLEREHTTAPGIYLKFAKKGSGIPSITGAEAVEVALCFGWIDGRANGIDDKWWTVRYTPRRSKSIWSQKNVGTIAKLVENGKMRPAGLAAVEAAKADGRWDRAYAGPATMTTPADLEEALVAEPAAEACFRSLNRSERYSVLWPLATTSDKNRAAKIDALVQSLAAGKVPGAGRVNVKSTKVTRAASKKSVSKPTVSVLKKKPACAKDHMKVEGLEKPHTPRRVGLRSRS